MSLGYVAQTLDAITTGVVESIKMAHDGLKPGRMMISTGNLTDASINRSPSAYLNNPAEERSK